MNYDLGANIRALRLSAGMTQEQLAQRLNLSSQAVSKWENGATMPDIQLLPELSQLFGVSIDQLFSLTDEARMARVDALLESVRFVPEEDFRQTERFLRELRDRQDMRPRATLLLAQLYNKRADEFRELAAPLAREALALNPDSKDAHCAVFSAEGGVVCDWNVENHHRLIDFYRRVVKKRPEDRRGYYYLLDLLIADGRADEARKVAQRLREVAHTFHYEMYMGQIALAEHDLPGALRWFDRMIEREPDNWLPWMAYADQMARLARWDEALRRYEKALSLQTPPRLVDCADALAQIHEIRGEYAAAIEMRRKILDILREDWHITEGEPVDAQQREIQRLRAGE